MIACVVAMVLGPVWVEAPAFDQPWEGPPARFEVANDVRGAKVIDEITTLEVPCKVQQLRDKRYVFWTRSENGAKPHRYKIETESEGAQGRPVFVGAGDMLDYGKANSVADMGVGLWATALPIFWNDDDMVDLVYSCQDAPQSGVYVYVQVQSGVFRRIARLGNGHHYPTIADMNGDGKEDLLVGDAWYNDIHAKGLEDRVAGPLKKPEHRIRAFNVRQVDWDGDGVMDLISGSGDWREYGWDRGFDDRGVWTRGPLHGPLFFHKNTGTNTEPAYAEAEALRADDTPIDVYGRPSPCVADWDGDGDLDLICGEFRDEFTYFENIGSRTVPILASPAPVMGVKGRLRADLCMISPVAYDWNKDGRPDLVVGQEDGRVSIMLHRGMSRGAPYFADEHFLLEEDPPIKSGALVVPWIDPETRDLYCGNTAGYIECFRWVQDSYRTGRYLRAGNDPLRVLAGYNGSVQGPAEEKWGYTAITLGDINNDGEQEVVYNSILGRIDYVAFTSGPDRVSAPSPVPVEWPGEPPYPVWNWWKPGADQLVVEWRTRPLILDWDNDGKNDLIAVDHEGYLAFFRYADGRLMPGERVFKAEDGSALRLNDKEGGGSGRAKIHMADWDNDGDLDLVRNTVSAGWFENTGGDTFVWRGDFPCRKLAGHTTAPQAFDWNGDGQLDLIIGAEDGRIYCYHRAALEEPDKVDAKPAQ